MSKDQVLIKVYGHVWPTGQALYTALLPLLPPASACVLPAEEMLELDKDLLRISFEGIYFPLDEVLAALSQHLTPDCQGKLDYIDLDAWTLTRHRIAGITIEISHAPLNTVLDHSGH